MMEGEYSYAYDEEASGTWYERNRSGQIKNEGDDSMISLTPAIITGIVAAIVVVLGGACFLCFKPKKQSSDSSEPVYQGGTML